MLQRRARRWGKGGAAALILLCLAQPLRSSTRPAAPAPTDEKLAIFKAWLEREHPGYGCDEGPAEFVNQTVAAAYPGRRFYYVLTHARGIAPPFPHSLSLVAYVSVEGEVRPFDVAKVATYRPALIPVKKAREARLAAAAVLILALGDPGEKRWRIDPDQVTAKKGRTGWVCTYQHGTATYESIVTFDKEGSLTAFSCHAPPVP